MESVAKRPVHQHQRDDLLWQSLHDHPAGGNTQRGYSASMSLAHGRIAYCAGLSVVVRRLDDWTHCEQFDQHRFPPTAVRFNKKGNWVISGDSHGTVIVWEAQGSFPIRRRYENVLTGGIRDICWTNDNLRFFVAGQGVKEFARALIVDSGSQCGQLQGATMEALAIDCRGDRPYTLALGGEDHSTHFYQGVPYKLVSSAKHHKGYVNCLRFRPSGDIYASVGSDKTIRLFQAKTAEPLGMVDKAHNGTILSMAWVEAQETLLVTCSTDRTIKLWDTTDPNNILPMDTMSPFDLDSKPTPSQQLVSVQAAIVDGNVQVVAMSLDGSIHRLQSDSPICTLSGHQSPVTFLCVQGDCFYSADQDGNIILHNHPLHPGQSVKPPHLQNLGLTRGMMIVEGYLVFANISGVILKIDTATLEVDSFKMQDKEVVQIAAAGDTLYVLSLDNVVQSFSIQDWRGLSQSTCEYSATCLDALKTEQGDTLCIGSSKDYFYLQKGTQPVEKVLHYEQVKVVLVKLSPRHLASADNKHCIRVYDLDSMQCMTSHFTFHNAHISCLAFHRDLLLSCSQDKSAILWNLTTLKKEITYEELHKGGVCCGAFTQTGHLLSAGQDHQVKQVQQLDGRTYP